MALFTPADLERIEATIGEIEAATSGEVVVAAVRRSSDYGAVRAMIAFYFGMVVAFGLSLFEPSLAPHWLLLAQVPAAALGFTLIARGRILRWVLPAGTISRAVEARAMQLFMERGVGNTTGRSGLLIVLSELEHRAIILGDSGIHREVGSEGWHEHVTAIVAGIRAGRAADSLIEVLQALGRILALKFPPGSSNPNELPNAVVES